MNAAEAAVLLARIAASDNREVSEAAARAWAETLPDVNLADALEWLPRFYRAATRDTKNWIYPGDVLLGVRELHKERRSTHIAAARQAAIDALTPEQLEDQPETYWGIQAAVKASREWDAAHADKKPGREIDVQAEIEARKHDKAWAS